MAVVRAAVRLLAVSALALACVACAGRSAAPAGSSASCVSPYLNDQPPRGPFRGPVPTVAPGATITVYGHWYTGTCNDTGGHDPVEPLSPVHLTLTLPDGDQQQLGTFGPDGDDMGFSVLVRVPATTRAGLATVHDDRQPEASFTFKVGP